MTFQPFPPALLPAEKGKNCHWSSSRMGSRGSPSKPDPTRANPNRKKQLPQVNRLSSGDSLVYEGEDDPFDVLLPSSTQQLFHSPPTTAPPLPKGIKTFHNGRRLPTPAHREMDAPLQHPIYRDRRKPMAKFMVDILNVEETSPFLTHAPIIRSILKEAHTEVVQRRVLQYGIETIW